MARNKTNTSSKKGKKSSSKSKSSKKSTTRKTNKMKMSGSKSKAPEKIRSSSSTKKKAKKEQTGSKSKPELKDTCLNKVINVLLKPTEFFRWLNEKTINKAFLFMLGFLAFYSFFDNLIGFASIRLGITTIAQELGMNLPNTFLMWGLFPVAVIASIIIYIIWAFVISLLLHLWILLFNGKKDFDKTFQIYAYSRTPIWLFGWIPIVWIFAWVYSLILLIIGTREIHGISNRKAIWMYLGPILVFLAIMIIAITIIVTTILNLSSALTL